MTIRGPGLLLLMAAALVLGAAPIGAAVRAGEIRGTIKDPNSNALLTEVHVTLVNTNLSSVSSNTGGYVLADVPAGTYELRAERIGYARVSKQITVADRQVLTVDLEMVTGTALASIANATSGRLMGIVTDANGAPLGDAQVSIVKPDGASLVAGVSRAAGSYLLNNIPPGTYEARVRREGSAGMVRPVTMAAGGIVEMNFQLAAPGGESTSSLVEPNLQREELIRALANRPPNPDGSPAVVINGALFDGPFALPTATSAGTSAAVGGINPNDIERVEVIKGEAAATAYGPGAANGLIHVILKKKPPV
jgi:TonB-dependent starch-binding outer membrane protein SusC